LKKSGTFLEGGEIHDATCENNYVSKFIVKPLEDPNPIRFCTLRKSQHPLNWHKWIINMVIGKWWNHRKIVKGHGAKGQIHDAILDE
jgi:hypothetical protein